MDYNPANQQLLRWYIKCYHSLNDTMLLDMIKQQVQNKIYIKDLDNEQYKTLYPSSKKYPQFNDFRRI